MKLIKKYSKNQNTYFTAFYPNHAQKYSKKTKRLIGLMLIKHKMLISIYFIVTSNIISKPVGTAGSWIVMPRPVAV